jgi:hypothetical protein
MEAARSASLAAEFSRDPSIWLVAARRWLDSGDADQANISIGKAVALGAEPGQVGPLQVTASLLSGDVAEAERRLRGLPRGRHHLERALVGALGPSSGLDPRDLASLRREELPIDDYRLMVLCLERALIDLIPKVRDLLPRARMDPNSAALLAEAEGCKARLGRLSELVRAVVPPGRHKESHESRLLAHILLSQSAMVVETFVRSNDPDQAEEAALVLSEAVKITQAVREAYSAEARRTG